MLDRRQLKGHQKNTRRSHRRAISYYKCNSTMHPRATQMASFNTDHAIGCTPKHPSRHLSKPKANPRYLQDDISISRACFPESQNSHSQFFRTTIIKTEKKKKTILLTCSKDFLYISVQIKCLVLQCLHQVQAFEYRRQTRMTITQQAETTNTKFLVHMHNLEIYELINYY